MPREADVFEDGLNLSRRPSRPNAQLAAEIIILALRDLNSDNPRHRYSALKFFNDDPRGSTLPMWCTVLDLDPDAVRASVRRQVEAGRAFHIERRTNREPEHAATM